MGDQPQLVAAHRRGALCGKCGRRIGRDEIRNSLKPPDTRGVKMGQDRAQVACRYWCRDRNGCGRGCRGALVERRAVDHSTQACALGETQLGGFVDIPGGGFVMGVDPLFPEEGPPRRCWSRPSGCRPMKSRTASSPPSSRRRAMSPRPSEWRLGPVQRQRHARGLPVVVVPGPGRHLAHAGWRGLGPRAAICTLSCMSH
jgi:hypothetical protein